jgi:hypothetical protein
MVMELKTPSGNRKVFRRIDNLSKTVDRAIDDMWDDYTPILEKEASRNIKKSKSGREYVIRTRSGTRRRHRASAPGESHANVTKTLTKSLDTKQRGNTLEFGYLDKPPDYAGVIEKTRPTLAITARRTQSEPPSLFFKSLKRKLK